MTTGESSSLLRAENLHRRYQVGSWLQGGRSYVRALRGVSLSLRAGETLALVGESGCGKSTLAKVLMRIEDPDEGTMEIAGAHDRSSWQSRIQMIFQDPLSSLNPRKNVFNLIAEPLVIAGRPRGEIRDVVQDRMERVGLRPEWAERFSHMLSGGQRQRVGIARALTLEPKILICDEPVSALDVSLQAQVINLLMKLQDELKIAYLFISHDLAVVKHIAHRIAVMYLGRIVEEGSRDQIVTAPKHPYTQALLQSYPSLELQRGEIQVLKGELPSPRHESRGCNFASRCPRVMDKCREQAPEIRQVSPTHRTECFL